MKIFIDIMSGDELCSDTYKINIIDDVLYEVVGKLTTERTALDESKFGANASEEDPQDNGCDPSVVSGVDVVLANRLIETGFTKKIYKTYIKDYMKKIMGKLEGEDLTVFKSNMPKAIKTIIDNFDEYQFFQGASQHDDGMIIPMRYYDNEPSNPRLYFFKHGIREEKCALGIMDGEIAMLTAASNFLSYRRFENVFNAVCTNADKEVARSKKVVDNDGKE